MQPNVVATKMYALLLTDRAMETLQRELDRDRAIRANGCTYCSAQPGDPCHTRDGHIVRTHYHVPRLEKVLQ